MLRGESLQEFYDMASQNSGTKNSHWKHIQEGLLRYFFLINDLFKKKRVMRH